jgi:O-acetyl-ADP-ribose deacetylase (regulator of RNase III)
MSSDFVIQVGLAQLQLLKGDITKIAVDAIVNAANSQLAGGGGVDGAIHRGGGRAIMQELDAIRAENGGCPTGSAVATGAGALPAKYVFHAVGPIYGNGQRGEAELLASCYSTALNMAAERDVKTISFPSISTGVYGYPLDEAANIALQTVAKWLRDHPGVIHTVKLVQFSDGDHQTYRRHAENLRFGLAAGNHG